MAKKCNLATLGNTGAKMIEMNSIMQGNCLDVLKEIEDNSIDAIITDPPAGISFMSKEWDSDRGGRNKWIEWMSEIARECLRVLKPGGHAFVWTIPRTSHWTATAWENAGFEIRDVVAHIFGSGFPKSLNIQKKIEGEIKWKVELVNVKNVVKSLFQKNIMNEMGGQNFVQGNVLVKVKEEDIIKFVKIVEENFTFQEHMSKELTNHQELSVVINVKLYFNNNLQIQLIPTGKVEDLKDQMVMLQLTLENVNINSNTMLLWKNILEGNLENLKKFITLMELKTIIGLKTYYLLQNPNILKSITGIGTALKPAREDWILMRKPIDKGLSIAENCLKWGCGGINIDESRVGTEERFNAPAKAGKDTFNCSPGSGTEYQGTTTIGRFPANLILEDCEEVRECFPNVGGGNFKQGSYRQKDLDNLYQLGFKKKEGALQDAPDNYGDSGNASRFFKSIIYEGKANGNCDIESLKIGGERHLGCENLFWLNNKPIEKEQWLKLRQENIDNKDNKDFKKHLIQWGNIHSTVKPVALMEYLIKMITPPNGIVLDPFLGSGTTGIAAVKNGYSFIGIELDTEYFKIAEARIAHAEAENEKQAPSLF